MKRDTLAVTLGVAATLGAGGMLTRIGPWYASLRKPDWQPPDWLFGPAWTLIGLATGRAALDAWRAAPDRAGQRRVLRLCGLNGGLNALWSALFFARRRPDWALAEVGPLWLSIVGMIALLPGNRRRHASLLGPYLAWVSFASVLNAAIVRLNRPFGEGPGQG